jgi:hypothetical protein
MIAGHLVRERAHSGLRERANPQDRNGDTHCPERMAASPRTRIRTTLKRLTG